MASAERIDCSEADWRRSERLTLGRPGTIRFDDGGVAEATILDLSRDGCRLATERRLRPNERVTIGLAHVGRTGARVVWHGVAGYGCTFDTPLPAGAVTAAFSPSNLVRLPSAAAGVPARERRPKHPASVGLAILAVAVPLSWIPILMLVRLLAA